MLARLSSMLEDYLANRRPMIKQLPSEMHDEVIGWHSRAHDNYSVRLVFDFGDVLVNSQVGGVSMYEMLVAIIDGLEFILESAKRDILRSSEINSEELRLDISKSNIDQIGLEDRESIMRHTYPSRINMYPADKSFQIRIQSKIGFWAKWDLKFSEVCEVYCGFENGSVVYKDWGFIT